MRSKATFLLAITTVLVLAAVPWLVGSYPLSVMSEILIFGILAASLNLLMGYTGMVSFGHAAFFGVGAYTASIVGAKISPNIFLTLTAAILLSVLVALIIGFFTTKAIGFYFLMLTLAFSQMIYALAIKWQKVTGGSNGFSDAPYPQLIPGVQLKDPFYIYYLILFFFVLVFLGLRRFISSPVGQTLIGIRENEGRLKALGYNTNRYKLLAFLIAGGLAGLAGALNSYFNHFVSPSDLYWTVSGHIMIMVIVGGSGTLIGPVLGAAFLIAFQSFVSSYTDRWQSIVGVTFILFVMFMPKGFMGLTRWLRWPGRNAKAENGKKGIYANENRPGK